MIDVREPHPVDKIWLSSSFEQDIAEHSGRPPSPSPGITLSMVARW